jgi:hypothetical protein
MYEEECLKSSVLLHDRPKLYEGQTIKRTKQDELPTNTFSNIKLSTLNRYTPELHSHEIVLENRMPHVREKNPFV